MSGRAAFSALRRSNSSRRAGSLTVVSNVRSDGDRPAVAYAISRKVGNAVVRNKVRRRLRELAREAAASGLLERGDHLVIAAPSAARRSFSQLRADLFSALGQRESTTELPGRTALMEPT